MWKSSGVVGWNRVELERVGDQDERKERERTMGESDGFVSFTSLFLSPCHRDWITSDFWKLSSERTKKWFQALFFSSRGDEICGEACNEVEGEEWRGWKSRLRRSSLVCFTHPPYSFLEALRQTVIESWTTRRPAIIPVLKVSNV